MKSRACELPLGLVALIYIPCQNRACSFHLTHQGFPFEYSTPVATNGPSTVDSRAQFFALVRAQKAVSTRAGICRRPDGRSSAIRAAPNFVGASDFIALPPHISDFVRTRAALGSFETVSQRCGCIVERVAPVVAASTGSFNIRGSRLSAG